MIRVHRRIRDHLHIAYALYGTLRYWIQYRKVCVVAVTGTDGKSSTVELAARLLRVAGNSVAHYSSVSVHDGMQCFGNTKKMTTPGRAQLHAFLAQAARNGAQYAVIEVTSESVLQWRHLGVAFDVLVYTNITPEHIEHHGSFDQYVAAKCSLLRSLRRRSVCTNEQQGAVVWNADDDMLQKKLAPLLWGDRGYTSYEAHPQEFRESGNPFLFQNLALANAAVSVLGVVPQQLPATDLQLPGRFEVFHGTPTVIVDYAHTPNGLTQCLTAARAMATGKVIHVFGAAGGGRDTWKRPLLAKISEAHADVHILTEENSFDEPVDAILADIATGFSGRAVVYRIPNREDAVRAAFALAEDTDLILCTAKGSETVIAGPHRTHRPYTERIFVQTCQAQKQ